MLSNAIAVARHPDLIKLWVDDFNGTVKTKMTLEMYRAIIDEAHKHGVRVAAHLYYLADAKQLVNVGVDAPAQGVRRQPVADDFITAMKTHSTWYIPHDNAGRTFLRLPTASRMNGHVVLSRCGSWNNGPHGAF